MNEWAAEAIQALKELSGEPEGAHGEAEDIVMDFLRNAGYAKVAEAFVHARERIGFWYA